MLGYEVGSGPGVFSEENNFHIRSVKMKIRITGMEAGWIVGITDVVGEEGEK